MNETPLQQISSIFARVLGNDTIVLSRETRAADVEDWDSLNHIQLVVAIEKHFHIKFSSTEIRSWKNVGDICDSVAKGTSPKDT